MLPHCRTLLLIKEVSGTGKQRRLLKISKLNTSLAARCVARLENWLLRLGISGIKQVQDEVILTPVKHSKQLMAGKRNSHSTQQLWQLPAAAKSVHRALLTASKSIKQTLSSQWNVSKRYYCLSLGGTPRLRCTRKHSFIQSSANKTFLPQVELITDIFIFSHRLKIKSLVQLYKNS